VIGFHRERIGIFLLLIAIGLISVNVHKNMPIAMVTRMSLVSFLYWIGITGLATLTFRYRLRESVFFNVVVSCLVFVAICGIAQFLLQFVGIRMFSFRGTIPDTFLVESLYNVEIPLEGKFIKSNGFFLVEPSTFSQFMALGLICEWTGDKRPRYLALFLFSIFISASGTGWLVLGSFILYTAFTKQGKGLGIAFVFVLMLLTMFIVISFIFPTITDSLSGRMHEFNMQGTSGNERFVTPVLVIEQVFHVAPWAFFTGIGPGGADELAGITYLYAMNTPIKITLEYGIFGLLTYLILILWSDRTPRQSAVLLPSLVLLLIAGGNDHFPPILFPVLLITTIANLKENT